MGGGVYFDDGANAAHTGVADDGFYVGGRVGLVWGVGTVSESTKKTIEALRPNSHTFATLNF